MIRSTIWTLALSLALHVERGLPRNLAERDRVYRAPGHAERRRVGRWEHDNWSSATDSVDTTGTVAWGVNFFDGRVDVLNKDQASTPTARAVRGGS